MQRSAVKYREMQRNAGKCRKMKRNVEKCREMQICRDILIYEVMHNLHDLCDLHETRECHI